MDNRFGLSLDAASERVRRGDADPVRPNEVPLRFGIKPAGNLPASVRSVRSASQEEMDQILNFNQNPNPNNQTVNQLTVSQSLPRIGNQRDQTIRNPTSSLPAGVRSVGSFSQEEMNQLFTFTNQRNPIVSPPVPTAAPTVRPSPQEQQGFLAGATEALIGGTKQTFNTVGAATDVFLGDNQGVVSSAAKAQKIEKDTDAKDLKALKDSFESVKKKAPKNLSLLGETTYYISNISGAMWDNLSGTGQFIAEQTPNAAVALGSGWAGAKTFGAAGLVLSGGNPAAGLAAGTAGFIVGMFGGNTLLETGSKAIEKAADKKFTDTERSEAIKEGATKGAVITAVDVATLGASKYLLGTASRAVEKATVTALEKQGINAERAAFNIKTAQDQARLSSAGKDAATARAEFQRATLAATEREGLLNPQVIQAVQAAQQAAYKSSSTLVKRVGIGAGALGLETLGEGVGEYLGELAATGKADVADAVIEALAGASQSVTELYVGKKLNDAGTLTKATSDKAVLNAVSQKAADEQALKIDALREAVSSTPEQLRVASVDVNKALRTQDGVALLAASYNALPAPPGGQVDTARKTIEQAAQRAGVVTEFNRAINSEETIQAGRQLISDDPVFARDFMLAVNKFAVTMPKPGNVKRTPPTTISSDDVTNRINEALNDPAYLESLQLDSDRQTTKNLQTPAVDDQRFDDPNYMASLQADVDRARNTAADDKQRNIPEDSVRIVEDQADQTNLDQFETKDKLREQIPQGKQTNLGRQEPFLGDVETPDSKDDQTRFSRQDETRNAAERAFRQKKVQEIRDAARLLTLADKEISSDVDEQDGRFERTLTKALDEKDPSADAAITIAEDYVKAGQARAQAQQKLTQVEINEAKAQQQASNVTTQNQEPRTTGLVSPEKQAALIAYEKANTAFRASQEKLEGKPEQKINKETKSALSIGQLKSERKAAYEAIIAEVNQGNFIEAEEKWRNYSNTISLIKSKIHNIKIEIAELKNEENKNNQSKIENAEKEARRLQQDLFEAKDEFAERLLVYVTRKNDSNLKQLVFKYLNGSYFSKNKKSTIDEKSFLNRYFTNSMYRSAVNYYVRNALNNNTPINLNDRPKDLYDQIMFDVSEGYGPEAKIIARQAGLSTKQKSFVDGLLNQTKTSDLLHLLNEAKERRTSNEERFGITGLSDEGKKYKAKLEKLVNTLYQEDTYKNLIADSRRRLKIIYDAINGKAESGDLESIGITSGSVKEIFDPSIGMTANLDERAVLIELAKNLEADIRTAMDNRIESISMRYKLASDNVGAMLLQAKREAMESGQISMKEINQLSEEAWRTMIVGLGYKVNTSADTEKVRTIDDLDDQIVTEDPFGETNQESKRTVVRDNVVMEARYAPIDIQLFGKNVPEFAKETNKGDIPETIKQLIESIPFNETQLLDSLIDDVKSGKFSPEFAAAELAMALRDKEISYGTVKSAMSAKGVDAPADLVSMMSSIPMQYSLEYWIKKNGGGYKFKNQWLTSYHKLLSTLKPKTQKLLKATGEINAYEEQEYNKWLKEISFIKSQKQRRMADISAIDQSEDIKVLDKFLFAKYSLEQLRNPTSLPEKDQAYLSKIGFNNLVREWHRDVYYAYKKYPQLRNNIRSTADQPGSALISADDASEHRSWVAEKKRLVLASLERDKKENTKGVLATLYERGGLTPQLYEKFYAALSMASMNEAEAIEEEALAIAEATIENKNYKKYTTIKAKETTEDFIENALDNLINDIQDEDLNRSVSVEDFLDDKMLSDYNELNGLTSFRKDFINAELDSRDDDYNFSDSIDELDGNLQFRDSDYDADFGSDRLRQGAFSGVVPAANVNKWVNELVGNWSNKPQITVVANPSSLPEPIRSRVISKLRGNFGAKGLFDSKTGQIYLFSDYLVSKVDTEFTLFHEAYGHLGMRGFLGEKFNDFLLRQYQSNKTIRTLADQNIANGMPKLEAIEEVLADNATFAEAPSAVKSYIGQIIAGLRKLGFNNVASWLDYITNAELLYTLKASREWAKNANYKVFDGAPSELRMAQGRLPYEVFAMRDGKLRGYARFNPLTNEWYLFSDIKQDIRDGYKTTILSNYDSVIDEMSRLGKVERRFRSSFFIDDKLPTDLVSIARISTNSAAKQRLLSAWQYFQNEYLPVFRMLDQVKAQTMSLKDHDLKNDLLTGERKTGFLIADHRTQYVDPIMNLVEEAKNKGATEEDINNYLVASTAEERNKQVKKINPKNEFGSGMAPRSRRKRDGTVIIGYLDVLENVANSPFADELYKIGNLLDKMGDAKVDYEVATGLISREEGVKRKTVYRHYRNLSGINSDLDADHSTDISNLTGKKFNLKGKDKRALGRGDIAQDVLARTLVSAQASIIRGQKNLIAQQVLAFFETNYDPYFVSINEDAKIQKVGSDGFVQIVDDSNYIARKDVMVAKVNGIPITIRFKELGANTVSEALHGMVYPPQQGNIAYYAQKIVKTVSRFLTTWNPLWIGVNIFRDLETLFSNAASDGRLSKGAAGKMVREAMTSCARVTLYFAVDEINTKTRAGKQAKEFLKSIIGFKGLDPATVKAYKEARIEGGLTAFIDRTGLEDQIIKIERAMNGKSPVERIFGVLQMLEAFTVPFEMAPRLAAYKVSRDPKYSSMTKKEAAVLAGEITVNFNMRGTTWLRYAYLFFNPAIQGPANMVKLAKNNPEAFARVAAMWIGLGAIINIVGRALGDEDDPPIDGISNYDKLPVYKRGTSAVWLPNHRLGAIPIAYGWNAFYALGHFSLDTLMGKVPAATSAKRIASTAFEAFAPIGTGITDAKTFGGQVAAFTPFVAAPIVQWIANENRHGAPIYRDEKFGSEGMPESQRAFRGVSPLSKAATDKLNYLTGGNKYSSGKIDVNPEAIDFIIESYLPGVLNEAYKTASTAARVNQGLEVGREKEPFFDRFSAYVPQMYDAAAYRRAQVLVNQYEKQLKGLPRNSPDVEKIFQKYPDISALIYAENKTSQNIRKIQSDIVAAEKQLEYKRVAGNLSKEDEKIYVDLINRHNQNLKYVYSEATKVFIRYGMKDIVMAGD